MSVKVEQITKLYGKQKALDEVSFEISQGEVVGLLGPNGAGKSTLMKILTCFIPPSSGVASINGYDVQDNPIAVQRLVGYLPEHNPLYLDMYVREYLAFVAGIYGLGSKAAKRIDDMIDITGLDAEKHKKIGALSKGYRQRVGIAQSMIHDPEVLILDEPTSGLDPNQLVDIRHLIKEIGREKTVILSTHIMQEVEAICDRAIIIHKGRIVADDQTTNLTKGTKSTNAIVVEFEQLVTLEFLNQLPGLKHVSKLEKRNWLLEPSSGGDFSQVLMKWAIENQLKIKSMRQVERSMEEIFQQLTRNQ